MSKATKKLNFLIEEGICQDLRGFVSAGKRSKVVNDALRRELVLHRREKAVEKILMENAKSTQFSNREILEGLAGERGSH